MYLITLKRNPKNRPALSHAQSFVIQGFGNVGSWAAQILYEMGGRVVAVSDAFGAIANEHGLQIPELRAHLADRHRWGSSVDGRVLAVAVGGLAQAVVQPASGPFCASRTCRQQRRCHQINPNPNPHTALARSLASFSGGVVMPTDQLLSVPCDVLIPAAIGGVIDESNANDLQCKVRRGCSAQ